MAEDGSSVRKAVVLARGIGSRMRRADATARLDPEQEAAASAGVKAMIPVGHPFLDYALSALADAGCGEVCLVIGPEHDAIRDHYARARPRRLRIRYAIQERPLGTADAVAAAEAFAAGELFLMVNADNYYPVPALRALRELRGPGLVAFGRESLIREGHIDAERVRAYAILSLAEDGTLLRIVEKPDPATYAAAGPEVFVSMNCWAFGPRIFEACRHVRPSARGELELSDAVQYAIERLGERIRSVRFSGAVLDLSRRADVAAVATRLADVRVEL